VDIFFQKEKLRVAYIIFNWFSSNLPLMPELCVSVKNVKPPFPQTRLVKQQAGKQQ